MTSANSLSLCQLVPKSVEYFQIREWGLLAMGFFLGTKIFFKEILGIWRYLLLAKLVHILQILRPTHSAFVSLYLSQLSILKLENGGFWPGFFLGPFYSLLSSQFQFSRICMVLNDHLFGVWVCHGFRMGDWELSTLERGQIGTLLILLDAPVALIVR